MSSEMPPANNPFTSPPAGISANVAGAVSVSSPPTYCKVMWIVDLVMCGLRIVAVMAAIVVMFTNREMILKQYPEWLIWGEIVTGLAIVSFGLMAGALLLMKKPAGIAFGWLTVLSVGGSVIVACFQVAQQIEALQGPERVGGMIGGGIAMLVRIAILGAYIAALLKFQKWNSTQVDREVQY